MADVRVFSAEDVGDDVLLVKGAVDGEPVEARGWVSALARHYPPEAYHAADAPPILQDRTATDADGREIVDTVELARAGHRVGEVAEDSRLDNEERTEPRAMTAAEARAYCEGLLLAAAAPAEAPARPLPVVVPLDIETARPGE